MVEDKFEFFAKFSSQFPDNKKPILVGGSAVEFYTRGMAKSIDMDIVADRKVVEPLLIKQGFIHEDRHFYKGRIDIEVASDLLHGRSNIISFMGYKIKIISVEDLIIDRMCGCKFWKSVYDCDQAQMLMSAYEDKLDIEYMEKRMKEEALD